MLLYLYLGIPSMILETNLPLWTPFLDLGNHLYHNGANFASAGAGVLPETNLGTIDLGTQLSYFKIVACELRQDLGDAEAKELIMEAVCLSSIGGNDYVVFHSDQPNATEAEQPEFVGVVIANLTKVVKEVYEIGGRKFAFQNVGPMGCLPSARRDNQLSTGDGCVQQLQKMASLHNTALLNATQELQSQLPGFVYSIFDYYTTLYDRIQNPSEYGFNVAEVAYCNAGYKRGVPPFELCGDPSEFVFFDSSHPTEATNSQEAELFWNGEPPITIPYNLKKLFELKIAENRMTNLVDG